MLGCDPVTFARVLKKFCCIASMHCETSLVLLSCLVISNSLAGFLTLQYAYLKSICEKEAPPV